MVIPIGMFEVSIPRKWRFYFIKFDTP